jgi:hypothetical protein
MELIQSNMETIEQVGIVKPAFLCDSYGRWFTQLLRRVAFGLC